MIQQPFAIPQHFLPATAPNHRASNDIETASLAWWFICEGANLLVVKASVDQETFTCSLPQAVQPSELGVVPVRTQFLSYLKGQPCIAAEVGKGCEYSETLAFQNLRSLYSRLPEDLFAIAARAVQITEWNRTHQYCGHCATPTTQLPTERAKRCPNCGLRQYPRLSPAVIVLIYKQAEILLARAPRFPEGMYSVLAGFVEPGESLEETVARETKEEVGIEIKNIRYFGSQPWPFPNSLMVGFTAEYAISIARKLIDWFVEK